MAEEIKLRNPWLIAVWPGMGHVAISAGYYLMAKLEMHTLAEFSPEELFDVEHADVKDGVVRTGRLPRSRFFVWSDPRGERDLVVFIGEAQPPRGKYAFCRRLIEFAKGIGVERVFTFAAMATQMHPTHESRVFVAATDAELLAELKGSGVEVLDDGVIGGLNGVLIGASADGGLRGACLLGEMPHLFAELPFPKASLAVLKAFTAIARLTIDTAELANQARDMESTLGQLLQQMERAYEPQPPAEEEPLTPEPPAEERPGAPERENLERLFAQATQDRSKAYELKRELDRLGIYREYEDRFLDLFKRT
jgi:proteasome assembly chaperone (PAC2) family protein